MNFEKILEDIQSLFFAKKRLNEVSIVDDKEKKEIDIFEEYLLKYKDIFKRNGYDVSVEESKVRIKGNSLDVIGDTLNTFWTGEGVLCKEDYLFYSKEDFVMVDIGLNIGLTSLSMARMDNIVKIYAYEPFSSTFRQAEVNMKRNSHLAKKINIFCYGLGDSDKKIIMNYNPELPGSMSSVKERFEENENTKKEEIIIKKSSRIFKDIIKNNKYPIFLKMDCEGAEEEILFDLYRANLLKEIKVMVLEWHFKYPEKIISILKKNDFIIFNENVLDSELGMIRAVYCKNPSKK